MRSFRLLLAATVASALMIPNLAAAAGSDLPQPVPGDDTVSTGVARARDRLDSATSTSVLHEDEIERLGARGVGDLLRDIPGLRAEPAAGEVNASLTVRGLPLASSGAKFIQFQENGLPTLEFGDIVGASGDTLLRLDLNLAQVDVIRGGSASTFASNSPGGVVNFRDKTGEVAGGAVALSAGLDYGMERTDFTYGGHLSDTLRFQLGGFYRDGAGPRRTGYDAQQGGQVKVNVTKEFSGGYVRLYGKYLNDRTPYYDAVPFWFNGTDQAPRLRRIAGFDATRDALQSRYIRSFPFLDRHNDVVYGDLAEGQHVRERSAGFEAQFDVSGWSVSDRFRYAAISGALITPFNTRFGLVRYGPAGLAGAGATLAYVNGPNAGQAIDGGAAPLNGNGLTSMMSIANVRVRDAGDVTNELRVSRVLDVGRGDLTVTAGVYAARQTIDRDMAWLTLYAELRGDGRAALLDIYDAGGSPVTDRGIVAYTSFVSPGRLKRTIATRNAIDAPFASLNYHVGRFSIGGSLRYDAGSARGQVWGRELLPNDTGALSRFDVNRDGKISVPEELVDTTPVDRPSPVGYTYHYLSYSTGLTYRPIDTLAFFGRYSKGARTGADRLLFTPFVNTITGGLVPVQTVIGQAPGAAATTARIINSDPAVNTVHQAEAGVKFRTDALTLNLTGFWASTFDANVDAIRGRVIARDYEARGLEFEGGLRRGVFALNGGATYTDAKIKRDYLESPLNGMRPRHQPRLLFQATPEIIISRVAFGAAFLGSTKSFAQDENKLVIPGYVTTNAFVQLMPAERLRLTFNANNVFNNLALMGIDNPTRPDGTVIGFVRARPLNGRTMSATLRFDF